jgi:hypothetical protein
MKVRIALITVSFAFFSGASAASALNLTGSWEGVEICGTFLATGTGTKAKTDITLSITQTGQDLYSTQIGGDLAGNSRGYAYTDSGDVLVGEASLNQCGSDQNFAVSARFKAKTKADGSAKMKGVRVGAGMGGTSSCKLSLKRISAVDPILVPCP